MLPESNTTHSKHPGLEAVDATLDPSRENDREQTDLLQNLYFGQI